MAGEGGAQRGHGERWLLLVMLLLQCIFLWVRSRALLPGAGGAMTVALGLSGASVAGVWIVPRARWLELERWLAVRIATPRRRETALLLLGCVAFGAAALIQQHWSWDEKPIWRAASTLANHGLGAFFASYRNDPWLASQHPPLLLLIYGSAMRVLGDHLLVLRAIDGLFGVATLLVSHRLLAMLDRDPYRAFPAALLLLASPLFVRMGSAASLDMPVTFLFVLSLLLAERLRRSSNAALVLPLGLAIGLGLVSKYVAVLVYPLVLVVLLREGRLALQARRIAIVLGVSLVPLVLWLAYADHLGLLEGQAARLTKLSGTVTRSAASRGWAYDAVLTKLPAALGVYTMPSFLVGAYGALRRRTREDGLLFAWILLVCVPLLLTLPDNRYFLPAFPAFAAITARALEWSPAWSRMRVLAAALGLCAATLVYYALIDLSHPVFLFRGW